MAFIPKWEIKNEEKTDAIPKPTGPHLLKNEYLEEFSPNLDINCSSIIELGGSMQHEKPIAPIMATANNDACCMSITLKKPIIEKQTRKNLEL